MQREQTAPAPGRPGARNNGFKECPGGCGHSGRLGYVAACGYCVSCHCLRRCTCEPREDRDGRARSPRG